jgi:hypothetical protein
MVSLKTAPVGACATIAIAAAPVSLASAHWRGHDGVFFGVAALGAATLVGAAAIVTAPAVLPSTAPSSPRRNFCAW